MDQINLYMWLVLVILTLLYVCYGIIEWNMHKKNLGMIPTRIVVNGTRGKSTVTRLVAAGLVGGGFRVMAKTTGTKPNIIINNEQEIPVVRLGRANIKEQLLIFKRAVNERVDAIVFENMSLRPDLQIMEESKIIQPQFVVITNVRQDHLDVMGPTPVDIVRNFINAVPQGSTVFTAENDLFPVMSEYAERKGIKLIKASEEEVKPEEMAKFPYVEHRENVALALKVCAFLGIPRERALNEMYRYIPDPGVLKKYVLNFSGKKAVLYNAMAANDPDSTYLIYERLITDKSNFYVLMNCRSDRVDRSKQMAELLSTKVPAKLYFVTGGSTSVFCLYAQKLGISEDKIVDLGGAEYEEIFNTIGQRIEDGAVILAIGNIVGYGESLIKFLVEKGFTEA